MNKKEPVQFIRENIPFYLTGLLLIFFMKYYYSRAGDGQLLWLLAPTSGWVSILSGISFEYMPGTGYVNHDMKILIAPSCSGMQFMLITAAMLLFSFVHLAAEGSGIRRLRKTAATCGRTPAPHSQKGAVPDGRSPASHSRKAALRNGFLWTGMCLVLSYIFTIFVNGLRIIAAIYLPLLFERLGFFGGFLTPDSLHTLIGTAVYFAALLTLYRLTGSLLGKTAGESLLHRCLPPVFWYFFIVLGIPFLNRAYEKNGEQFVTFAAMVAACCGGILLLYCAGTLLRKSHSHPKH